MLCFLIFLTTNSSVIGSLKIGLAIEDDLDKKWFISDTAIKNWNLINSIVQIHFNKTIPKMILTKLSISIPEICNGLRSNVSYFVVVATCIQSLMIDRILKVHEIPSIMIPYSSCKESQVAMFSNYSSLWSFPEVVLNDAIGAILETLKLSSINVWTTYPLSSRKVIQKLIQTKDQYPKLKIYESSINLSDFNGVNPYLQVYQLNKSSNIETRLINIPSDAMESVLFNLTNSSAFSFQYFYILYSNDKSVSRILSGSQTFLDYPNILLLRNLPISMDPENCEYLSKFHFHEYFYLNALKLCTLGRALEEKTAMIFLSFYYIMIALAKHLSENDSKSIECRSLDKLIFGGVINNEIKTIFMKNGFLKNVFIQTTKTNYFTNETIYKMSASYNSSNLTLHNQNLFLNTLSSLNGRELIIESVVSAPFLYNTGITEDGFLLNISGFSVDLLNEISRMYNFKYKLKEPRDLQFGIEVNKTWNGMIGDILAKKIDLAVGPFTITAVREKVVHFTELYMEDGLGVIIARPQYQTNIFKALTPFSYSSWLMILFSVFATGLFMYGISYYSPFSAWNLNIDDAIRDEISLVENIWSAFGSLLMQGQDFYPRANSSRIVLGVYWIFTILILATYTADLTAYLSKRIPEDTVNSLEDILKSRNIKPLVKQGTNAYALFELATPGSVYAELFKMMTNMPEVKTTIKAIELVKNEKKWAFISDISQISYFGKQDCDSFKILPVQFNVAGFGWPLPRQSPYRKLINEGFSKLKENGFIRKLIRKWWLSNKICNENNAETSTLTIGETGGVFIILMAFILIGFLLLGIEKLISLKKQATNVENN